MCFSDPQDNHYNRFWARHILRLDIDLWTNTIDESGLFNVQGRYTSSKWVSWTYKGKPLTYKKAVAKNIGE